MKAILIRKHSMENREAHRIHEHELHLRQAVEAAPALVAPPVRFLYTPPTANRR